MRYDSNLTFDGVYTYDTANFLYKYLSAGKSDINDLLGKDYNGISGLIRIDEYGASHVEISLAEYNEEGIAKRIELDN
jgi:hypothetical protein